MRIWRRKRKEPRALPPRPDCADPIELEIEIIKTVYLCMLRVPGTNRVRVFKYVQDLLADTE